MQYEQYYAFLAPKPSPAPNKAMLFKIQNTLLYCNVLLTAHLTIILVTDQLNAQILVSSHFVGGRPVHRTATYKVGRYQMLYNTIWPLDDEHSSARKM